MRRVAGSMQSRVVHHLVTSIVGALLAVSACSASSTAVASTTSEVRTSPVSTPAVSTSAVSTSVPTSSAELVIERRGDGVTAITYDDAAGAPRTVLAEIRVPRRADGPLPVVVWSHGGSSGKRSTVRVGDDWGRAFTGAGFAFVAIAHPGRDRESRGQLCGSLGVGDCSTFRHLDWDRPADVRAVLDWLAGDHDGRLDLDRAVYGGHSAGGRSVLRLAGADWPVPGDAQPSPEERFAAFLVASPPGASANGLTAESFLGVTRPVLLLSGAGDTTTGNLAVDRLATMELVPEAQFASVWVDDDVARHSTIDLDRRACRRSGGSATRCAEIVRDLGRAGTSFVRHVLDGGTLDEYREAAAEHLAPDVAVR